MYPFITIPKAIFKTQLSSDAKIIYMSMLDTYKLSFKNSWLDDNNRIFIYYSIPAIQKSIGCSRPKAIKILNELEENGYIVKEVQKGRATKIYLVENEYTEFELQTMKKHKKDKQEISEVGADEETAVAAEQEATTIADYTADADTADNSQSICSAFKAIIGREPDNSFKKCIAKREKQMGLTAENMRGIIELAKKARNPEAYILSVTKPNQEPKATYQTVQAPEQAQDAPLEAWEIEWLLDVSKHTGELEKAAELEQMLAVINQKKAEQESKLPLDNWEIEWLNEIREEEAKLQNMSSLNTFQNISPGVCN